MHRAILTIAWYCGDRCLQEDDPRHPLHGQRPAKHRLPSRNSFLDSTEALNTSKQDARTTLWVEEWNALGERSTEWRDRGIIPNEHLASGTDEPWSTWRSLNRLRVQKGRCRAMMKMWKLSHTDVCDCGERQTMSHLMTCAGYAPNCTWTYLAFQPLPVSTVPNTGRNQSDSGHRGLDEEEYNILAIRPIFIEITSIPNQWFSNERNISFCREQLHFTHHYWYTV